MPTTNALPLSSPTHVPLEFWLNVVWTADETDEKLGIALQQIFERFSPIIERVVEKLLSARSRVLVDSEQIAIEVMHDLLCEILIQRKLQSRSAIVSYARKMAKNRVINEVKRMTCGKRFPLKRAAISAAEITGLEDPRMWMCPDLLAEFEEHLHYCFEQLESQRLRQIFLMRIDGFRCSEIADALGVAKRTVERSCNQIKEILGPAFE